MNEPKASNNKAPDVETPKEKRIAIPEPARTQILQRQANLNTYISGVASALGIVDWALDLTKMEFVEKPKKG